MKIPLKMRVMEWLNDHQDATLAEIMDGLRGDYGHERQHTLSNFSHMMQAMKAVGIVEVSSAGLDEQGNAVPRYTITENGVHAMKHIPGIPRLSSGRR